MSTKVRKIFNEISSKNFPNIDDLISKDTKEGSYDSIFKKQIEIRAEKLRDTLIEIVLDSAKDIKLTWEDLLCSDECRPKITSELIMKLTSFEHSKRALNFVDELCDKLLANEEQK